MTQPQAASLEAAFLLPVRNKDFAAAAAVAPDQLDMAVMFLIWSAVAIGARFHEFALGIEFALQLILAVQIVFRNEHPAVELEHPLVGCFEPW